LIRLTCDERFDERIGGLSIERQSVAQRLEFEGFFKERLLQTAATSVEILFDSVKSHVQDGALFWSQILFEFFGYFLR
jgi:hypothetical protein